MGLFLDFLSLSCVMVIQYKFIDGVDGGVGQIQGLHLGLTGI